MRSPRLVALACLPLACCPALAADGIDLTVTPGPGADDVALQWTGNQPLFQVYRSAAPASVADPVNLQGETAARTYLDPAPVGDLIFYLVARKPDPPATMIDGAEDRIPLGAPSRVPTRRKP